MQSTGFDIIGSASTKDTPFMFQESATTEKAGSQGVFSGLFKQLMDKKEKTTDTKETTSLSEKTTAADKKKKSGETEAGSEMTELALSLLVDENDKTEAVKPLSFEFGNGESLEFAVRDEAENESAAINLHLIAGLHGNEKNSSQGNQMAALINGTGLQKVSRETSSILGQEIKTTTEEDVKTVDSKPVKTSTEPYSGKTAQLSDASSAGKAATEQTLNTESAQSEQEVEMSKLSDSLLSRSAKPDVSEIKTPPMQTQIAVGSGLQNAVNQKGKVTQTEKTEFNPSSSKTSSADGSQSAMVSKGNNVRQGAVQSTGSRQFGQDMETLTQGKVQVQVHSEKSAAGSSEDPEIQFEIKSDAASVTSAQSAKSETTVIENFGHRSTVSISEATGSTGAKDGAATASFVREPITEQIVSSMTRMVRGQQTKLTLSLKPQELGALKIELSTQQSGLEAKFVVESKEVRQMVEASLPELKTMMERQGIQVDSVEVQVRTDADSNDSSQNRLAQQNQPNWNQGKNKAHLNEDESSDDLKSWQPKQYGYNSVEYVA